MENSETDIRTACRIVAEARDWLGTPYLHQTSLKGIGCDCIGLIRGVWREIEGDEPQLIPAYSSAWAEVGEREQLIDMGRRYFAPIHPQVREPGDVLVFRMRANVVAKHVGIYSGGKHFIHAYQSNCVAESALSDFWERRIASVFRFPSVMQLKVIEEKS